MVDVTKLNFAEEFLNVTKAIDESEFVSIDTELTGLFNTHPTEHAFDSMEERYSKLRRQCSNTLIIQFGLSTFKYHPKQKKYTHQDFNFYIFPCAHIRQAPNPRFVCETSSLHFLSSRGFDFNKVINEGVPYLTHAQEAKLREYLSNKHKLERERITLSPTKQSPNAQKQSPNTQNKVDIPEEHKQFIEEIKQRVDSFITNETETVLQLEPCSAYRRKLIYEILQEKYTYGIDIFSKVNENNLKYFVILKNTDKDKLFNMQFKEISDLNHLDTAVGFRKVTDYLLQSKKLIVGQCMYLDILHTIEQFYFALPEDLQEYKSIVNMMFPHLLDTRYMASSEEFRPFFRLTSLAEVLTQMAVKGFEMPEIEAEGKCYELKSEKYHEAGYDAYLAGVCFIGMAKKLGSMASPSIEHVETTSPILLPYLNKIHIVRHYDIACLNLRGPDLEPNRDNVFHVSIPSKWKTEDLVELFLPYGKIYVFWLDGGVAVENENPCFRDALVALKNPANTISAKAGLLNKFNHVYRVKPYADYLKEESQQHSFELKPAVCKRRNSVIEDIGEDRLRSVARTLAFICIACVLFIAIIKIFDPQLSSILAFFTYYLSYYICMAIWVQLILMACVNTISLIRVPFKCMHLGYIALSVTFIALALCSIEGLFQFNRSNIHS